MHEILFSEALDILTTDPTYRKDVYFAVSLNNNDFVTNTVEHINGVTMPLLRVDRGQIYSKSTIYELGAAALFGGIYVEE